MAKPAPAVRPRSLGEVDVGHEARLADGAWVLVTCRIGAQPYVRPLDDVHSGGPRPMPAQTPVVDSRARVYAPSRDAGTVADPLSVAAEKAPDLFTAEDR